MTKLKYGQSTARKQRDRDIGRSQRDAIEQVTREVTAKQRKLLQQLIDDTNLPKTWRHKLADLAEMEFLPRARVSAAISESLKLLSYLKAGNAKAANDNGGQK